MWFNNALLFQYTLEKPVELALLLADEALKPCPPHARFIYGWMPVFADQFVHETASFALFCMGKEERILPKAVINRLLAERIAALETQQGRSVKRAEKAQMAEDLEFELLPKSFCLQKRLYALFDKINQRLIINTSSSTQASQLTSLLRKTIPGIQLEPLSPMDNLGLRFASWVNNPSLLPSSFQLASDCLLFSLEDEKKRFTCKGYELPAEEVLSLLSQGLAVAELSVVWNERIQFTLTHELTLKKMKCLDYLLDEFNDIRQQEEEQAQQDAALALLGGELNELINALLMILSEASPETLSIKEETVVSHPI